MNKKIIVISCTLVMVAVIAAAILLKYDDMIAKLSIGETNKTYNYAVSYADNNTDSEMETYEIYTYEYEDEEKLRVYDVNEDVTCGMYNEENPDDDFNDILVYHVNSAERISKITNLPEECKDKMFMINSDGTPEEGYEFIVVDITVRNNNEKSKELTFANTYVSSESSVGGHGNCEAVYFSEYSYKKGKSVFEIEILAGGEYSTKVVYAINKECMKDEMYYIINPAGVGRNEASAAAVRIKLEGESHEADI